MGVMKLLALADLHGELAGLDFLPKGGYDAVVFVGDVTDFGPAGLAREVVRKLKALGKPVLVTPGNCDPREVERVLEEEGVNLHRKSTVINKIKFFGLGGSNPTPFDTPFELSETEMKKALETQGGGDVLLSHAPPKNTACDLLPNGMHVGSTAVREVIEEYRPKVVVCGHVHEAVGVDQIGSTIIVNPGLASKGCYAIIDLSGGVSLHCGRSTAGKGAAAKENTAKNPAAGTKATKKPSAGKKSARAAGGRK